jgi:hypothetical protein
MFFILPEIVAPVNANLQPHQYLFHRQLKGAINATPLRRLLQVAPIANLTILISKQRLVDLSASNP